jgi:hypothetical protein
MTEKEVQLLGFQKEEDYDGIKDSHYYTYDIVRGLSFISNDNQEAEKEGQWYVDMFNTEVPIRFYKFEEVQVLINLLEKRVIR